MKNTLVSILFHPKGGEKTSGCLQACSSGLQKGHSSGTLSDGFANLSFRTSKKTRLSLLNNILGGPAMNNRLSMRIREKYGLPIMWIRITHQFSILFLRFIWERKGIIWKKQTAYLEGTAGNETQKLSTRQLSDAKKQIIGQIAMAQDSGSAIMFNIAKSLQLFGKIDTLEKSFTKSEKSMRRNCTTSPMRCLNIN
ncbi:MAG: hypothetical protein IPP69_14860 [Flavobacteriales bacterium]|nr:hypothetical protein [Flavobacteriales bacterium]